MTDEDIISAILLREGGFVDHPLDKGGATKYGVTHETLESYRGHDVTVEDVKALTQNEARMIYRQKFILEPGLFVIKNDTLRALLVDMAVNHGPRNAVKLLQRALGVSDDGMVGEKTVAALGAMDAPSAYRKACAARVRFYGRIITNDPKQAVFAADWMDRVADFVELAA